MKRFALVMLLGTPFAVAAPVPKDKEREQIEKKYGKIVDPKGDSQFKLDGDKLTITLPADKVRTFSYTEDPADPKNTKKWRKTTTTPRVEFTAKGDFVLTVRVTAPLNADAGPAKGEDDRPFLGGGVQVVLGDAEWILYGFGRSLRDGRVGGFLPVDFPKHWAKGGLGSGSPPKDLEAESYIVRATRVGKGVTMEASVDGKKWEASFRFSDHITNDEVKLSLYSQHSSNKKHTVTFSEFEVKPVEKK